MKIEFPAMPYGYGALAPHISAETLELHHGKHQRAYFDKLGKLLAEEGQGAAVADEAGAPLEAVIRRTAKGRGASAKSIFNNAAQLWNHSFFWASMAPQGGGGEPAGAIGEAIKQAFGDYGQFREKFLKAAEIFGSGWVWVSARGGKLEIEALSNAGTPVADDKAVPLLVVDVWEHAYYVDYRNRRPEFVKVFLDKLVNWSFADQRLAAGRSEFEPTASASASDLAA